MKNRKTSRVKSWLVLQGALLAPLAVIFIISYIFSPMRTNPLYLPSPLVTFDDPAHPYAIVYPETWVAAPLPHGNRGDLELIATFGVAGRVTPRVNISTKRLEAGTLEDALNWGLERAQRCHNFKALAQPEAVTTPNSRGFRIEYECTWKEVVFLDEYAGRCMDYYTISKDAAFALAFCARINEWEKVSETFNQMMASFHTLE